MQERFFTLPLVFTKDPETGIQNVGMYRLQVFDKNTTGMHWHLHKDGRELYEQYKEKGGKMLPVSVALGCDPAITYSATAPLPKMIDEMMFAGFLRKAPVKLVKSITNDIYVPADAEFVIEGYVDVNEELRLEGTFWRSYRILFFSRLLSSFSCDLYNAQKESYLSNNDSR